MQFDERRIGDHRIYAGAIESRNGDGYTAALIVERRCIGQRTRETFRDEHLACGHRWPTPSEALAFALQKGRALVREPDEPAREAAVTTAR